MFSLPLPFQKAERQPQTKSISLEPVEAEAVTPTQFLQLIKEKPDRIESSRFIAPRLEDDHFGYFEIEYKAPVYK